MSTAVPMPSEQIQEAMRRAFEDAVLAQKNRDPKREAIQRQRLHMWVQRVRNETHADQ